MNKGIPFYTYDRTTNKTIYAVSSKKIAESKLVGEEYFEGKLDLNYLTKDRQN